MEAPTLTISEMRDLLSQVISGAKQLEKKYPFPALAEVVLARRAAEDSRLRLGVANAYLNEQEPFEYKHDKEN